MVKNIIFDIGNVLTDFCWEEFYKNQGFSEEILERVGKATVLSPKQWCEYDRGALSDEEIVDSFVRNDPEIEKEIRQSQEDLHGMVTRREYAIPWVKELKAAGWNVYYLSNFSKKAAVDCADALDFIPYMDGGILSFQDKLIKPDAAIYELLLKRYSLKAEECVFLDDTPANVEMAKKVGIHSFVFTEKALAEIELEKLRA